MPPKTKDNRVTNALTGKKVSPDIDWLIDRLAALNPAANDRLDVIDYHAYQIYGHWLEWRWRGDNTAIEIRGTQRPRAKRVDADRGTTNELKRLLTTAQGRSDKRWLTAWLGVSSKTHGIVLNPMLRQLKSRAEVDRLGIGGFEVDVRGYRGIMPTRPDALPLIEAAIRKLESVPAVERRKRERDTLADDFIGAVRMAHRVMVHDSMILHGNGLARFGRDINERLRCDFIF